MATIATAWTQVHPSFVEPGLLLQYNQASGAFNTLATGNPLVKIGTEDLAVYIKRLDIRTVMAAGQQAYNQLPSVAIVADTASTPTYLQRVRAQYDHHDTAAMSMWGASIVEAQRLGMRQGHFQLLRDSLLYGMNPANGEGLLNANSATTVNLPADSFGNTTVVTYDPGQMGQFLLTQLSATKARTMQLGLPRRFVFLMPQRDLGAFQYQNIVQLTSVQRPGAGSLSTAGMVKEVGTWNGDEVLFCADDTLINKGAGGTTDAVLCVMPEVEKPAMGTFNTNEFAKLEPGLAACTLQYTDMAAPVEIPTPLAGGAIDILSELRATPGWAIRPEALTIISMLYS
ncbi:MAG: DUF2184 domain-containing protein [Gammaproteobacteria bacterium]